jgi:hypothetical protein
MSNIEEEIDSEGALNAHKAIMPLINNSFDRLDGVPYEAHSNQIEQRVSPHECSWKYSNEPDEDVWETSCGQLFMLSNEDTPSENGFRFCCYCGKKLVSV